MFRLIYKTGCNVHSFKKILKGNNPLFPRTRFISTDEQIKFISNPVLPSVDIPVAPFHVHMFDSLCKNYDKVALVDAVTDESYTYGDVHSRVMRAASGLSKLGLKKNDFVTIYLTNCIDFPIAFLSVICCGAISSAVNPIYTEHELHHSVSHTQAKFIITQKEYLDAAKNIKKKCSHVKEILCLGDVEDVKSFFSLYEDDGCAFPDKVNIDPKADMAALPFSSGTTGLPKGVMLSHYNLVSNLQQLSPLPISHYHDKAILLAVLPFFHIYGLMFSLMLGLQQGIKIISMPKFDAVEYLKNIEKYKVTNLQIVPPIALFLEKHPIVANYKIDSIEDVLCAAAPLGIETAEALKSRLKQLCNKEVVVRQGYGMTETSPVTHCNFTHIKQASIGRVVPDTQAKIIDLGTGENLGPFKDGELCTKGPQVMLGYYQNMEATQQTVDQDGWLHSGDIGHYDDEGFFYVTDRLKELIKYKGFQVAPAELEDILLSHPAIADCAVIGRPDERAGELPCAYVVLKPNMSASEEDIKKHVKGKVAEFKELSGGVIYRNEIPKSASGKIFRRYLRDEWK